MSQFVGLICLGMFFALAVFAVENVRWIFLEGSSQPNHSSNRIFDGLYDVQEVSFAPRNSIDDQECFEVVHYIKKCGNARLFSYEEWFRVFPVSLVDEVGQSGENSGLRRTSVKQ